MITILNFSKKAILLLIFSLTSYLLNAVTIAYVTQTGAGTKNGTSWANAYSGESLQIAINQVATLTSGGQVWVATGTYYPTMDASGNTNPSLSRSKTFSMKNNVAVYGGFAGTETNLNQRIKNANTSILSGVLPTTNDPQYYNVYVVLTSGQVNSSAIFDGFSITGSECLVFSGSYMYGSPTYSTNETYAGVVISGGIVSNCSIYSNSYNNVYMTNGTMSNCKIYSAISKGVVLKGGRVINSSIYGNSGSGIEVSRSGTSVEIINSIITNNINGINILLNTNSDIKIVNSTVVNNKDYQLQTINSLSPIHLSPIQINNSVFMSTVVATTTPIFKVDNVIFRNCAFASNALTSNGYSGTPAPEITNDNQLIPGILSYTFMSPSPSNIKSTDSYNWSLKKSSLLIDKGNNAYVTDLNLSTDYAESDRIMFGTVDIGAIEYTGRRYVTVTGAGTLDGSSWDNAYPATSLQIAINSGVGEVWVAAGTYYPSFGYNVSTVPTDSKNKVFTIPDKVNVFGGFVGNENKISERITSDKNADGKIDNWEFTNETNLSGDIGTVATSTDNCTSVVRFVGGSSSSFVDGVSIRDAYSPLDYSTSTATVIPFAVIFESGTGVRKLKNSIVKNNIRAIQIGEKVELSNCYITNNGIASLYSHIWLQRAIIQSTQGGLIDSSLVAGNNGEVIQFDNGGIIRNTSIVNNSFNSTNLPDQYFRGLAAVAIRILDGEISNSIISGNSANGKDATLFRNIEAFLVAGIVSTGSTIFTKNKIIGNTEVGLFATGNPTVTNCIIAKNASCGIYLKDAATIQYSTFYGNGSSDLSHLGNGILKIDNSIISGTSSIGISSNIEISNSALVGGYANGTSIISLTGSADVKFVDPSINDWTLQATSPLINKGKSISENSDIVGNPRPDVILGGIPDIGAYELQSIVAPSAVSTVTATVNGITGLTINWTAVTCTGYLVLVKEGSSGIPSIKGTSYNPNTVFSNGDTPDGSWYSVYDGTANTVSITGLTTGTWYRIAVIPYNGKNYKMYSSVIDGQNVIKSYVKAFQTITFNPTAQIDGQATYVLDGFSSSNLPLTYTSNDNSVALPNGNTLQIFKTGTVTITASQSGNDQYLAATSVVKTIAFGKLNQTITFLEPASATYGDIDKVLSATTTSGLPITYSSSNSNVATITNGWISYKGAGTVTITASQSGNTYYEQATSVAYTILVAKAAQTITFDALSDKMFSTSNFALAATTSSGLLVNYTSSDNSVISIAGNIATINAAGTATITASQSGNTNYFAATSVPQALVINPVSQTITFSMSPSAVYGDADVALTGVASSGLSVQYSSSNTAVATVNNGLISFKGVGTTTITASQSGNASINPATSISYTLTVTNAPQTITFGSLPNKTYGDVSFALTASSTSGLGINYVSSNNSILSIAGNIATIYGAGTVTVKAYQNGNTNYAKADTVSQSISIAKKAQSITMDSIPVLAYGVNDFAPVVKVESNATYSVWSENSAVATVVNGKIHVVGVGTAKINAMQYSTENYLPVAISRFLKVVKAPQSITFATPSIKSFSDSLFVLDGLSSSGLPITYTSSNTAIASISNDTVVILSSGKATITAQQAGNAYYEAASNVARMLNILPADQYITFNSIDTVTFGQTSQITPTSSTNSGLPVSFTSYNLSVAKIVNGKIEIVGAGSSIIMATQAGNTNYNQAVAIKQELLVKKASQILTVSPIANLIYGASNISVTASSTSGLPITIISSDASVISVQNNTLNAVKQGSANISITQAGNDNYEAASKTQIVHVNASTQIITFTTIASKTFGDANFELIANSTSNLAVTYTSSNPTVASIAGNIVTIKAAGTATITASQAGNGNYSVATDVNQVLNVSKASQILSFTLPTIATYGDADVILNASTTSNLPVIYTSDNLNVATISNGILSIKGAGSATITASVASNANYTDATPISYTLNVSPKAQTISFGTLVSKIYGDASFALSASANSGLAVTYTSSNPTVASIAGNIVTIKAAGTATITASQAGNGNYSVATDVNQVLNVGKASQILSFTLPTIATYGDADVILNASTTSNLPVIYTSDNLNVATISNGILTIKGSGSATITASVANNANYTDATPISYTLNVSPKAQTISYGTLVSKIYGDASFALSASANSGLAVTYTSSNPTVASIAGNIVTIKAAGTATITASQAGNGNYSVATDVNQVLNVGKASQILSFTLPTIATYGDADVILNASTTSNLPVIYTSDNLNVATISNGILTIKGAGSATITALVASNANYSDVLPISYILSVSPKAQSISMDSIAQVTYGSSDIVPIVKTESNGELSFSTNNSAVASISNGNIHINGVGSAIITATQKGTNNYLQTSTKRVLKVIKASQIISFSAPSIKTFVDSSFVLDGVSSSGLALTYTSNNPSVATILGDTVIIYGAGKAIITANQIGDSLYLAANPVSRLLSVLKSDQTISFDALPQVVFGNIDTINPVVSSSSLLPINVQSSNYGVAKIENGKIVIVGAGEVIISASQLGNENYNQSATVQQMLIVNAKKQTLSFTKIDTLVYGQKDSLLQVQASSGLPVILNSSNATVIQIIGQKLHVVNAGTAQITISQAGNKGIATVDSVITIVVTKADQKVTFSPISNKTIGDADFNAYVSASSNLDVTLSSKNENVATISNNTIHLVGTGMVEISATQLGNENFNVSSIVSQTFTVNKIGQTITFNTLPIIVYGQKQVVLDGISSSGLPLLYESSNPSVAEINGHIVAIKAVGSVVITAKQLGDTNTFPSVLKQQTLTIVKRPQQIEFNTLPLVEYAKGLIINPQASSNENLPITYSSSNVSVASIENGSIVIQGAGIAIIKAIQIGNDTITAAQSFEQQLEVTQKKQYVAESEKLLKTLTYSLIDTALNIKTTEGLSVLLQSETPNIIQIVNNKIKTVGTGKATLRLVQSGNSGISSIDTTIYITVEKATQTILFASLPLKKNGTIPFKLFAKASSGLTVEYSSSSTIVAEIVENEVTVNAPGISIITASVPESENYLAASVTQPLVVTALNTLKMPLYTISRDTTIDLSSLVLNNDSFSFTFIKANHILATVQNTLATISINSNDKAWIGTDTLWFKATNTTNLSDIQMLGVKVRRIPLTEEIGLVTVDSTTATNTIIAWERSKNAGIKGYIIYRGGNSKDIWDSIAYVPATEKSYFVDKNVNVNIQAYQYSMVTVDSNNLHSNRSSTHTTMHLMTGVNLQNKPQLWWSPYVGADVESYIIYHMNQTTGKLDSIGSSSLTSFTDVDAGTGSKDYRVGIRFNKEINPKHLKADSGPWSVSLSNMAESELVDAPIISNNTLVKAYPNPTSGKFTIEINGQEIHDYTMQILNVLGEVVIETKLGRFSNIQVPIDASSLSQNLYQIKVICDEKVITMPIIIAQ